MMSQAKLLKFKTYPANLLFREFFNFEANYLHQADLPTFPKELRLDTSEFKKGFQKISAFAISSLACGADLNRFICLPRVSYLKL